MNVRMAVRGILLGLLSCGLPNSATAADEVLGKIGNVELKTADVRKILEAQDLRARTQLSSSPQDLDRFIRTELMRQALVAEARAKSWDKRPEVAQLMERAREQVLVSSYINSLARPAADYPGDAEIVSFYEANKARLTAPAEYRVAQIYLSAPEGAEPAKVDAARKKAEDLAARARRAGADFSELAKASSAHEESAAKGGDMGWLAENQLAPEIRAALTPMKKGEVSAPIRLPQGWHVLKLLDVRPASVRPLNDVREAIVAELRLKKAEENEAKYLTELMRKTPSVINEIELTKLQDALREPRQR